MRRIKKLLLDIFADVVAARFRRLLPEFTPDWDVRILIHGRSSFRQEIVPLINRNPQIVVLNNLFEGDIPNILKKGFWKTLILRRLRQRHPDIFFRRYFVKEYPAYVRNVCFVISEESVLRGELTHFLNSFTSLKNLRIIWLRRSDDLRLFAEDTISSRKDVKRSYDASDPVEALFPVYADPESYRDFVVSRKKEEHSIEKLFSGIKVLKLCPENYKNNLDQASIQIQKYFGVKPICYYRTLPAKLSRMAEMIANIDEISRISEFQEVPDEFEIDQASVSDFD
ncbi:MAG: hypothetical protein KC649_03940 [Candidatus Omnitrophica bacterium]|nr:hypothetical protein [Candidatus Omnitrophota bacterium]